MTGGEWPADPDERLVKLVHDLRTPLTIVNGFTDLLAREWRDLDDERRDEYLTLIAAGAKDLKAILDDEHASRHA